ANLDTRLLNIAVLRGILAGHTEEDVNLVNAPTLAEERGIRVTDKSDPSSEDFTELITVTISSNGESIEVSGTGLGPRNVPRLVSLYGQSFNIDFADNITVFRYADRPGMIGNVGTVFGDHGVNIDQAAVGAGAHGLGKAVMAVTTVEPVPNEVLEAILQLEGFIDGHVVSFTSSE
ncbi:MAG: ACT domain-containing protein, partial [Thermoleophilaceae bacterium]|nr:ACT domain-containing protein [Thermoleophilaceae bacterium]